ncbi:cytochrome P450 [Coprinopsis marcescibilis]|uniref:Cytochrome P450 n=1 Tax=Coprinopsis marcescibilis TaxID=230819 RepID=A0A5C3KYH7_COPMA|nr:cytochrome P450 [Coprinopsis marcescibilis]
MSWSAVEIAFAFLLTLVSGFSIGSWRSQRRRGNLPFPPQPPGWPIIGNLLDIPSKSAWECFMKWGEELDSDIVYANLCGSGLVVINSFDAATDLLDKRSGIYSDRQAAPLVDDVAGFGYLVSRQKYGNAWRERRRLLHEHLRPSNSSIYEPKILEQVRRSMVQVHRRSADDIQNIFRHMTGGIAISLAYGLPIQDKDDPGIIFAQQASLAFTNLNTGPAIFIVERFPLLRYVPAWLPGASFKRRALKLGAYAVPFREKLFAEGKANLRTENAINSFASCALERARDSGKENVDAIKDVAAIIFAAGSETTYTTISLWIRAMLVNPEVQRHLHQEVDSVVCDRLPEFSDLKKLPFLEASVMESFRLYPSLPTGISHALSEDDVYRGYFIPKGSTVLANAWAMLHNEKDYPDAMTYNPGRFIKDDAINPAVLDPRKMFYGFGRRVCAGAHIANATLLMSAATILALFEIRKTDDDDRIDMGAQPGSLLRPVPYRCVLKVRNKAAESVLLHLEESLS